MKGIRRFLPAQRSVPVAEMTEEETVEFFSEAVVHALRGEPAVRRHRLVAVLPPEGEGTPIVICRVPRPGGPREVTAS